MSSRTPLPRPSEGTSIGAEISKETLNIPDPVTSERINVTHARAIQAAEVPFEVAYLEKAMAGFGESANTTIERAIRISDAKAKEAQERKKAEKSEYDPVRNYFINLINDYIVSGKIEIPDELQNVTMPEGEEWHLQLALPIVFNNFHKELRHIVKVRNRHMIMPVKSITMTEIALIFQEFFGIDFKKLIADDQERPGFMDELNRNIERLLSYNFDNYGYIENIADMYFGPNNVNVNKLWGIKKPETALYDTILMLSSFFYILRVFWGKNMSFSDITTYLKNNFSEIYTEVEPFLAYVPNEVSDEPCEYITKEYVKNIIAKEGFGLAEKAFNLPQKLLEVINMTQPNPGSQENIRSMMLSQFLIAIYFRIIELKGTHIVRIPSLKKARKLVIERIKDTGLTRKITGTENENDSTFEYNLTLNGVEYPMKLSIRDIKKTGSILIKNQGKGVAISEQTDLIGLRIEIPSTVTDPELRKKIVSANLAILMNILGDSTSNDDDHYKWSFGTGKLNKFSSDFQSLNTRLKITDSDEEIFEMIEVQICQNPPDDHKEYKTQQAKEGLLKNGLIVERYKDDTARLPSIELMDLGDYFLALTRTLIADFNRIISNPIERKRIEKELAVKGENHSLYFKINSLLNILTNPENIDVIFKDDSHLGPLGEVVTAAVADYSPNRTAKMKKTDNISVLSTLFDAIKKLLIKTEDSTLSDKFDLFTRLLNELNYKSSLDRANYLRLIREFKEKIESNEY